MLDGMSGSGTKKDPYQISDAEELQAVRQDQSAYYELANKINAEETGRWNGGQGFSPIGNRDNPFTGSLDGNNFVISNLHIDRPEQRCVGLFGYNTRESQIRDLGLTNTTVKGGKGVGGLAGSNNGEIISSYVRGDISGEEYVGGLAGDSWGKVISSYVRGDVSGEEYVGGLTGDSWGKVISSYAIADVTGTKNVGVLIGVNTGEVESSYAIGDISGDENAVSAVGRNDRNSMTNSLLVFSSLDKDVESEDSDLVISKNDWKISYVVDTNMLYLSVDGEKYSCCQVSPIQVQKLVKGLNYNTVEITGYFKSSVVAM